MFHIPFFSKFFASLLSEVATKWNPNEHDSHLEIWLSLRGKHGKISKGAIVDLHL